jgi:hypothetical protein
VGLSVSPTLGQAPGQAQWPRYLRNIPVGNSEIRIRNHHDSPLRVGLRHRNWGRDFEVPAGQWTSAYVLGGHYYDVYLQPKNDKSKLYQGDIVQLAERSIVIIHIGLDPAEEEKAEAARRNRGDGNKNYRLRKLGQGP